MYQYRIVRKCKVLMHLRVLVKVDDDGSLANLLTSNKKHVPFA